MSATYEQQYGDILEEFVIYCNKQTPVERMIDLDKLMQDFITMKMERYNAETE